MQQIFERYEQIDSGITAIGGGIGLGLSICKQLVELHGGTIEVRSTPGYGSEFSFSLPFAEPSEQHTGQETQDITDFLASAARYVATASAAEVEPIPADHARKETVASDKARILAVDDDPVNLGILKEILPSETYEIVTVATGREAMTMLDNGKWDLIIADVMMPYMSGYELTRLVRERFSVYELPILLLTARSRPEDADIGFRCGANDYVTKPIDGLELRARVKALTELKRSVHERLRIEAAFLQAQIEPHFLFNTLSSIAALSENDVEKMRELLNEFAHFLQASFASQNADQFVPLSHELDLIQSYLYIEQVRFEERLNIQLDVDENLMHVLLPPLSIQPLVENAVRHGVLARSQGGTVSVLIASQSEGMLVTVRDDGVGMKKERLQQVFDRNAHRVAGIGLRNTDRRLKQLFGEGLRIESEPGQGTTVSFFIPTAKKAPLES
ncbi:ATP-binding protein [Brevibacillus sp. TJ4]|uniref:ATP-binding protein n=1 Tax=Brevibacillus sp. TJ4 TaxID=3234853 RepID=UPI003B9E84C9